MSLEAEEDLQKEGFEQNHECRARNLKSHQLARLTIGIQFWKKSNDNPAGASSGISGSRSVLTLNRSSITLLHCATS